MLIQGQIQCMVVEGTLSKSQVDVKPKLRGRCEHAVESGRLDGGNIKRLEGFAGTTAGTDLQALRLQSAVQEDATSRFAYLQCCPSKEHVGSICVLLQRDKGEPMSRDWADMECGMFLGLPGADTKLQLADAEVLGMSVS